MTSQNNSNSSIYSRFSGFYSLRYIQHPQEDDSLFCVSAWNDNGRSAAIAEWIAPNLRRQALHRHLLLPSVATYTTLI